MILKILLTCFCLSVYTFPSALNEESIKGSWKDDRGVFIFADNYFSYTAYDSTSFGNTFGGSWKTEGNQIIFAVEFDTYNPERVGGAHKKSFEMNGEKLMLEGSAFNRTDDGKQGALAGAWLFATRVVDGKPGERRGGEQPRKTMKILSGTRFQWIAYNTETKEFFGTGGGTYTTINGKYTEKIEFFSRDQTRVGASLEFDYELQGDDWHHQGLNSSGEPMYEIWARRQ